ncbi:ABC transporter permease subunit [Rhizobium sp. KVB221]|uniref:ABC transporter permease subunit n=1 Tax=Rhizobium setariae TaxID=2801340 RepID=A0A936YSA9_9HYPH|nr:ABC transporter permease subunit [Rhizobium setariae]MBL0373339.1 ABC transporter permease subunit [Rhizobium setariae]
MAQGVFDQMATEVPQRRSALRLEYLVGPLWQGQRPTRFYFLYLLVDACALMLVTRGWLVSGLALALVWRATALAISGLSNQNPASVESRGYALGNVAGFLVYCLAMGTILLNGPGSPIPGFASDFPSLKALRGDTAASIDAAVRYLTVQGDDVFRGITKALLTLLSVLESALVTVPWPVVFIGTGFLAWKRDGVRMLAIVWVSLAYLGIFGFWTEAMQTAALVLASLAVCVVIGIPLGIAIAKYSSLKTVVSPVLDLMQTMPSFVYLLPAVAFFSIGKPPALIATVIFSVPPLIRLTCLGIEQVPLYVREAMYSHGATPFQTLIKAELPLALPSIRAGVNQTIMMCLSMVVIAALIGGGGLGYNVLFALQNVQYGEGILAGLAIVVCAVMFDRLASARRSKD